MEEAMEHFKQTSSERKCQLQVSSIDELEDMDQYEDDEEDDDEYIVLSFACEDCDYRWEISVEDDEEEMKETQYCPMCGTSNTTQI